MVWWGPPLISSTLADFLAARGVSHVIFSPHYPQSNCKVEDTVKSISAACTSRLVDWNKLSCALIQYRNTPCQKDGLSPAQKLFGHPVQDTLPAHWRSFAKKWQKSSQDAEKDALQTQEKSRQSYNQHACDLPTLGVGNHVAIQNPVSKLWDIYSVITAVGPFQRYFIKNSKWACTCQKPQIHSQMKPVIRSSSTWRPCSSSYIHTSRNCRAMKVIQS